MGMSFRVDKAWRQRCSQRFRVDEGTACRCWADVRTCSQPVSGDSTTHYLASLARFLLRPAQARSPFLMLLRFPLFAGRFYFCSVGPTPCCERRCARCPWCIVAAHLCPSARNGQVAEALLGPRRPPSL